VSDDALKAAEKRGYARGYAAGRARKQAEFDRERARRQDQAFLERAFLAALPSCIDATGWKIGDKPINTLDERVDLAWKFAAQALKSKRNAK
jgi:hypothetical protein